MLSLINKFESKKDKYISKKLEEIPDNLMDMKFFKKSNVHNYGMVTVSLLIFSYMMYLFHFAFIDGGFNWNLLFLGSLLGLFFIIVCIHEFTYRIEFKEESLLICSFFMKQEIRYEEIFDIYVNGNRNRIELYRSDDKYDYISIGMELKDIYVLLKKLININKEKRK